MLSKLYTWLDITASTAVTIAVAISFFFSAFVFGNRFGRFHFSSSPFSRGRENALAVVMSGLGPEARSTEEEGIQKTTEHRDCGKEDENSTNSNHNGPDKEDCKLLYFIVRGTMEENYFHHLFHTKKLFFARKRIFIAVKTQRKRKKRVEVEG